MFLHGYKSSNFFANFFNLIIVKHIIWIIRSSTFITFGPIERILELSGVKNLFLHDLAF